MGALTSGKRVSAAGRPTAVWARTALACLVAVSSLRAEETTQGPAPPRIYSTATVVDRPLASATATIYVIDRAEIEALGVRSVAELVSRVPGLQLLSSGSRGGLSAAQIRGGDPNFTLVLVDGIPVNDLTDTEGGAVQLASLPVDAVERIEVVAGPLSSHFGSTGLAGALHIVTRGGRQRGVGATPRAPAYSIGLVGGSCHLGGATASLTGSTRRTDHASGVRFERESGRVGDDRFEQLDLHTALGLDLSPTRHLRLTGRFSTWQADDYPEASGGPLLGSGELRHSEVDEWTAGAHLVSGQGAGPRWTWDGALYHRELSRRSPAVGFSVPEATEASSFTRLRSGVGTHRDLTDHLLFSGGIDLTYERGAVESMLSLPPALGGTVAGDYSIERTYGGPFGDMVWQRRRWLLEVGARLDLSDEADPEVSPRLAAAFQAGRSTRLRASAGRGFKLPSFFALASPRALGGNPALEPERVVGFDLGVRHELGGAGAGASFEATVFLQRYEDLVDFDFGRFLHVNRGRVESRGLELAATWQPHPRLSLRGTLTLQRVEDPDASEPLLHRPESLSSLWATWELRPDLHLTLDARQFGPSLDRQIPVPERDRVPGSFEVGASAAWQASPRMRLRLRLDNLLDRDYENLIGFPAPGRSLRVGLTYTAQG